MLPPKKFEDLGIKTRRPIAKKQRAVADRIASLMLNRSVVLTGAALMTMAGAAVNLYREEKSVKLQEQEYYHNLSGAMQKLCREGKELQGLDGKNNKKLIAKNPNMTAIFTRTPGGTVEEARTYDFYCPFEGKRIPWSFYDGFVAQVQAGGATFLQPSKSHPNFDIPLVAGGNFQDELKTCMLPYGGISENLIVAADMHDGNYEALIRYRQKEGTVGEGFVHDLKILAEAEAKHIVVMPESAYDRGSDVYTIKAGSIIGMCESQFKNN